MKKENTESAQNPPFCKTEVSGSFSYKTISAHNNDLYEPNGWAYKHLIELGKEGWEVVKIQSVHECGSWVFLKNYR